MRRRVFNLATLVSLGLCVAMCALWWRSYFFLDRVVYATAPGPSETQLHLGAESTLDTIAIGYVYYRPNAPTGTPPPFTPGLVYRAGRVTAGLPNRTRQFADENGHQVAGFGLFAWALTPEDKTAGHPVYNYGLLFPHWAAALVSGGAAWLCYRRRGFVGKGLCPTCGYDLRATPDRCPECGRIPDTSVRVEGS
jgi:hypothetical protein